MKIDGRDLALTNHDKVLYPGNGFTKGQVIDYYTRVSSYLLPHLKDRPLTLKRYPDGVNGEHFYEKNAPRFTPEWVAKFPIPRTGGRGFINYILVNDLPTLVWCANLANLEMHPFLAKAPAIDTPTMVVFDLDPGEGTDILGSCEAAFWVKELLDRLNLESFVKVSGSKGIHLHVPLNTPVTYEATQPFAQSIAQQLETERPQSIVSEMAVAKRKKKIFVDWSQNSEHKSTVSVYSLRAKSDRPYVAMPVEWKELKRALQKGDPSLLFFEPEAALKRVEKTGDIFAPVLTLQQTLPEPFLALQSQGRSAQGERSGETPREETTARHSHRKNLSPRRKGAKEKKENNPNFASSRLSERNSETNSENPSDSTLETYRRKRDFSKTPEPPPEVPKSVPRTGERMFVIQKHAASHLHYDLRLEMNGVLKSWAVPKGPPYALSEKRLAMAVEDHPMDYAHFEGTIPKGEYGGGTVMVWDTGTYEIIDGNYWQGKLHVVFHGKKLEGEWVLVKSGARTGKDNQWLLIKAGSGEKALSAKEDDRSALTGRSMDQIAAAADAVWHSNKPARNQKSALVKPALRKDPVDIKAAPSAKAKFIEPMLAKAVPELPESDGNWLYELKLDGYRGLAVKQAQKVSLYSRNHNLLNARFPTIVAALQPLEPETVLDGEIVALDEQGRPSFNILQNYRSTAADICYYVFDLPIHRGKNLMRLPVEQRRAVLQDAISGCGEAIRFSQDFTGSTERLISATRDLGMEGLLAKKRGSLYEPGERSGAWVKFRINKGQELVIGGYIPAANYFDSLLVGYYEGDKLMFVAKIRNGFVPRLRREVFERFKGLETDKCPFANLPEPKSARRGLALTAEAMRQCRWLKPKLVAQIEFTDWTESDHLRHSKFVALRDDKDPREVTHEVAAP